MISSRRNVLVTAGTTPVPLPKVIDFGIAKATDHHLTEKTLFTEFRQMIGTPDYMAPEQAEMSGLDIDTRADVYSLGVMTYELLTGSKPFDMQELLKQGYEEIVRTIREVDPPKPSTRLSTMGELLQTVAKRRHTHPALLGKLLRGDLDRIVMKALEKDRARRYDAATALAEDIQRYLDDEPVVATSPSAGYRARKYLRRHRVGATAAAMIAAALLVGGGLAFAGKRSAEHETRLANKAEADAVREARAAREAEAVERQQTERAEAGALAATQQTERAETVLGIVERMLAPEDPERVKDRDYPVRQLLDDFHRELSGHLEEQPEIEAVVRYTMAGAYLALGMYVEAEQNFERVRTLAEQFAPGGLQFAKGLLGLAGIETRRGRYPEAERLASRAVDLLRRAVAPDHPELGAGLSQLAFLCAKLGQFERAEALARESIPLMPASDWGRRALVTKVLATVLQQRGDYAAALALHREAVDRADGPPRVDSVPLAEALHGLGGAQAEMGDQKGALATLAEAAAMTRRIYGDEHASLALVLSTLSTAQYNAGQFPAGEKNTREVLKITRAVLGEEHELTGLAQNQLALFLVSAGTCLRRPTCNASRSRARSACTARVIPTSRCGSQTSPTSSP